MRVLGRNTPVDAGYVGLACLLCSGTWEVGPDDVPDLRVTFPGDAHVFWGDAGSDHEHATVLFGSTWGRIVATIGKEAT